MGLGGYLTNGLLRILREDFKSLKLRIAYRKNRKHYAACHRVFFVIFRPHQKKITYQPTIKLFDNNSQRLVALECKTYVKYLGVLIDQHLSWKHHIDHIALTISKTVGIIARLRHCVPFSILSNLYRSLILPYLSYGVVAWGRAAKYLINKLILLQKCALRCILQINNNMLFLFCLSPIFSLFR